MNNANNYAIESLVGNAEAFPILNRTNFLDHAATSPLSTAAAYAQATFVTRSGEEAPAWPVVEPLIANVRATCAALIGAGADEVAFVKNTSEGICTAAFGLSWARNDRVVLSDAEFSSNALPWIELRERHGVEVVVVQEVTDNNGVRRTPIESLLKAATHERTTLVTVSHVQFASGQRFDLASIGRFCRSRGILFCVDAIQSLGVFPVNVEEMCIDILVADGHKWLLSSAGTGFLYVRRSIQQRVRPLSIGWLNVRAEVSHEGETIQLAEGAKRFEAGSLNVGGLISLDAGIRLLLEIGIEKIERRVKHLKTMLQELIEARGYIIASPRGLGEWSGIVSCTSPTESSEDIVRALKRRNINVSVRDGLIRISPHFYNTDEQIGQIATSLTN